MRTSIQHIDIFTETGWVRGGSLLIEDTRIAGIFPAGAPDDAKEADQVIDARGHFAIPGFIDTHVHGGGGHDINDGTVESILRTRDFYQQHGVTAIAPSWLALPLAEIRRGLESLREARRQNQPGQAEILPAHLDDFDIHKYGFIF